MMMPQTPFVLMISILLHVTLTHKGSGHKPNKKKGEKKEEN